MSASAIPPGGPAADAARSRRRATGAGLGAIGLWAALALSTASTGAVPPFLLVALTFAVGTAVGLGFAASRGRPWRTLVAWPAPVWALGVFGLFGYHALYFAALRLAPPAEAGLVAYLWPLLIVLLAAPLAGERLRWWHLAGAGLGLAGVVVLAAGQGGLAPSAERALGYALALGCAFVWSLYSVLSRRFGEIPTDAVTGFCAATALLAVPCHLVFETTVWPAGAGEWAAVLALGLGPAGAAFYLWDHAVKRGDIRALGALSYLTPVLSTLLLLLAGRADWAPALLAAVVLVVGGAILASRDLWARRPD